MSINQKILVFFGSIFGLSVVVVFTYFAYQFFRPPWIDWDEFNPAIHGKEIQFSKEMVYTLQSEGFFGLENLPTNVVIREKEDVLDQIKYGENVRYEVIKKSMKFYIESTFLVRKNIYHAAFTGSTKAVVLMDENKKKSIISFRTLRVLNRSSL